MVIYRFQTLKLQGGRLDEVQRELARPGELLTSTLLSSRVGGPHEGLRVPLLDHLATSPASSAATISGKLQQASSFVITYLAWAIVISGQKATLPARCRAAGSWQDGRHRASVRPLWAQRAQVTTSLFMFPTADAASGPELRDGGEQVRRSPARLRLSGTAAVFDGAPSEIDCGWSELWRLVRGDLSNLVNQETGIRT